ncbi:retrovirus-related pol polyprotein from transposon TNT 1-94 [Tanacetum coccineum]|uniref:Retrovirus-related pol polyprotein from transposon TNT 1-94 n=1 Tax=Tanacetum coccineum TaxID=301880 RepID=A0ABQ5D982_9ASTR
MIKEEFTEEPGKEGGDSSKDSESNDQEKEDNVNNTNTINAASTNEVNVVGAKASIELLDDLNMPELEDIVYSDDDDDWFGPSWNYQMEKWAIGTKWVFRNKKDERGIVIKNKARLVVQGYTQEEGIDYDEMDVKSAFLYGNIEEEVYVCQSPSFEDPNFTDRYSEELNNAGKILDESKGREKVFRKEQTFVSNNSGAKFKQNKKQISRRPKRKDTEVPQPSGPTTNVTNKAVYEERDDSLERDTTTATGLHIEQDMCNINMTQSKATPNEPSSPHGTNQGRSFRRQGKPWGIQLLHTRVIDLEKIKTAQAQEITSLKLRVKKLEKKGGSRTHKLKRLYQGRKIDDIEDKDAEITYG